MKLAMFDTEQEAQSASDTIHNNLLDFDGYNADKWDDPHVIKELGLKVGKFYIFLPDQPMKLKHLNDKDKTITIIDLHKEEVKRDLQIKSDFVFEDVKQIAKGK